MNKIFFSLLLLISISGNVNAQKKKDKNNSGIESESDAGAPADYKKARQIVLQAKELLKQGELEAADSLINESIRIYPTKEIFEYAKLLCELPDLSTANNIMDKAFDRVRLFEKPKIVLPEPVPSKFVDGKMISEMREYELERALMRFGWDAFLINREFGGWKREIQLLEKLTALNIKKDPSKSPDMFKAINFDFEFELLTELTWTLALNKKEFDKAIDLVEKIPSTMYYPEEIRHSHLARIYYQKSDLESFLKHIDFLKGGFLYAQYKWKFIAYAESGKNDAAIKNFNLLKKTENYEITNDIFYGLALIDINKKNYQNALVNLDSALYHRHKGVIAASLFFVDRWKIFKLYGDAYAGLGQYEKAKDNYNIALFSNPEYEPAIIALTMLESEYAQSSSTDKSGPVISLTEPSSNRGLIIETIESKATIKGLATDPSGIKEVTMNGHVVFSKFAGEFWGEVSLNEGINKVNITATDQRGNKTEKVFDIEKRAVASVNSSTTVKQGINYALLLAAQNYNDSKIPSLENPVGDAVRLKLILKNHYNFEESNIISLFNPEKNDIKRQLLELTNIIKPEDNLIIFYAGHGIWVEKDKKGFWMLIDSKLDDVNTWLPNKDVLDLIAKLPARNTLLITDACFSGSVFKTRGLDLGKKDEQNNSVIQRLNDKISRVAITSGNDTEVPDKSVFMKYLVKALSENKEKYLTAQKMFINHIIESVMTETKTEPRYGTLELAGHVGGDFIFIKR